MDLEKGKKYFLDMEVIFILTENIINSLIMQAN